MSLAGSSILTQPVRPRHFWRDVICGWIDAERTQHRDDPQFADTKKRLNYIEIILLHGNSGGRHNETIDLPDAWTLDDIEAVLGVDDDSRLESGSDASWRAVRRHYDMTRGGRGGCMR